MHVAIELSYPSIKQKGMSIRVSGDYKGASVRTETLDTVLRNLT